MPGDLPCRSAEWRDISFTQMQPFIRPSATLYGTEHYLSTTRVRCGRSNEDTTENVPAPARRIIDASLQLSKAYEAPALVCSLQ